MNNFKIMKVFFTSSMPKDVRKAFRESGVDNIWTIKQNRYKWIDNNGIEVNKENEPYAIRDTKIDTWLIENGANDAPDDYTEGETVVIIEW